MAHEVIASIRVVLPEGHSEMAGALAEIAQAWSNFLGEFQQYEGSSEVTFAVNETRTKPGPKPQRKPREKLREPEPQTEALEMTNG